uniref:G-protein coupled receptors family 1 profile domain-containing protein n=1 Tax=Sinocyclocheilus rhinocerous TaxID=307959 RepID=A0A673KQ58_9TELE
MENSSKCCAFEAPILDEVLPLILFVEFIFGLMGNILALSMFFFHRDTWKPNSVYLAHLAVADSVVLFCLPFRMLSAVFCCFFWPPTELLVYFSSLPSLVDRHLKIVHPLNRINPMGLTYALWVSVGLWGLIIAMTVYLLTDKHFYYLNNHTQCESFNICLGRNALSDWHNAFCAIQFFVPTAIAIYCPACITWQLKSKTVDTQGKIKRAVQFILAVALVFIICFFPSNVSRIAVWVLKSWYSECQYFRDANVAFYTTVCFTYFNSVLNPIVYYFSSTVFSGSLKKLRVSLHQIKLNTWSAVGAGTGKCATACLIFH